MSFLIIVFVIFLLVRTINQLRREEVTAPAEPTTKERPYCLSTIPVGASRCVHCISELLAQYTGA